MASCNQNEDGIIDSPSKQTTTPIGWSVLPIQSMQGSRALISSDDDLQSVFESYELEIIDVLVPCGTHGDRVFLCKKGV